ncbi:MAG: hypothetical protein LBT37_05370 [Lactobacillaceae bacterium]|jgi:hypothetical protein|nr:hypothetical protein [Lactobacillaceae bacterium]
MANLDDLIIYNQPADLFIKYAEASDLQANVAEAVVADTFAVVIREDQFIAMTYGEWETLRVQQANEMVQAKLSDLTPEQQVTIAQLFNTLSEGMAVKYQGAKSWNAIYDDLLESVKNIIA